MTARWARIVLSVLFGLHAVVPMVMSVLAGSYNGGRIVACLLALATTIGLWANRGARITGSLCLGLLAFRLSWMLIYMGLPMRTGLIWLATFGVTAAALFSTTQKEPPAKLNPWLDAFLLGALAWTAYTYAEGLIVAL